MNCITVFCGSSYGKNEVYKTTAYELGKRLAENGINLIYGDASVGLMGTLPMVLCKTVVVPSACFPVFFPTGSWPTKI